MDLKMISPRLMDWVSLHLSRDVYHKIGELITPITNESLQFQLITEKHTYKRSSKFVIEG